MDPARASDLPATASAAPRLGLVDLLKAVSSQLIVWHHLAFYGPMSDVVHPHARWLVDLLYQYGRAAVYVFLVLAAFLAAGALLPAPGRVGAALGPADGRPSVRFPARKIASLFARRFLRLARPYWVAIAVAIVAAAIARRLFEHEATPAAPTFGQILAHAVMLHDLLRFDALSAGVWYVAIDLQLHALLLALTAAIAALVNAGAARWAAPVAVLACCAAMASAWLVFGRDERFDVWALYFLGAYGLGLLARWCRDADAASRGRWLGLLAAVSAFACAVDPRARTLVAVATAALLASRWSPGWAGARVFRAGGRISYSLFLVHYPVCLLVNAIVFRVWGDDLLANALGLPVAWLASNLAGWLLYRAVEAGPAGRPADGVGRPARISGT